MFASLIAIAALATAPSSSTSKPTAAATPLAAQVAREFLTPELWQRTVSGLVPQLAAQIRADVQKNGGTVDDGLEANLKKFYDELMPYSWIVDLQAGLLQKHFSQAELLQLRDFYRSPLGRKVRERTPEIQQDVMGIVLQRMSSLPPEKMAEVFEKSVHRPAPAPGTAPAKGDARNARGGADGARAR